MSDDPFFLLVILAMGIMHYRLDRICTKRGNKIEELNAQLYEARSK